MNDSEKMYTFLVEDTSKVSFAMKYKQEVDVVV